LGNIIRQELERDETTKLGILGFVDDAHTTAAELLDDAVARNGLTDQKRETLPLGPQS
jgi:hypothetical protein